MPVQQGTDSELTPPPGFDVKPSGKERALGVVGAMLNHGKAGFDQSPLGKRIAQINSQRLNEAAMHHQNMATYAGILATGINPQTGQPLTSQERQQYQDWYNAAKGAFIKAGGIDKDTKAAIGKGVNVADAIIQRGQQAQAQRGNQNQATRAGGVAEGGGGLTPPPKAQDAQAQMQDQSPTSTRGGTQTPASVSTSAPYDSQVQADAPRLRAQVEDNRKFDYFKRQEDLLHQHKMEEEAAKAQATQSTPRPIHSGSLGVVDARTLAAQGQVFLGEDGDPIDLSKLPDSMGLYGIIRKNSDQQSANYGRWETVYEPFSPSQRTVTVGNETYAVSPMDISKLPQGQGSDLGEHRTPTASTHETPMLGPGGQPIAVPLHSTSTPSTSGVKGRGGERGGLTPPPATTPAPAGGQTPPQKGYSSMPAASSTPPRTQGGARPLPGVPTGVYDQFQPRVSAVRAAATQLFGDPENVGFKPLSSYADVVDSPKARDRVATAWNLIRSHMDQAGVNQETHGDIVNIIRNYLGTPGAVAESEVAKMQETLDALKPREYEMLNRLFTTYGTVIGIRSITKASAARFSARNMEQEVPIPGMNVRTSRQFYDKLSALAEEVSNGWKGVPSVMLTPGEREYDMQKLRELQGLAQGGKKSGASKGLTPPPASSSSAPKTAEELEQKYLKK